MNKKLLTLAVAAALTAPSMASAEAIMYGKLNVSLDYIEINDIVRTLVNTDGTLAVDEDGVPIQVSQNFNGWDVAQSSNFLRSQFAPGAGPSNRFGIKGSEDLGNGLKAVYQIEVGVNFDTNNNLTNNNDTFYWRNTFAGLAGDWGTVLIGRHDTPLKISTAKLDLFADTLGDMNATVGFMDLRADSTVAYISPSWSGFQLALATVPAGGATAIGQQNINSDEINGAYSMAAIFKNGPFYATAAYEVLGNEMFMNSGESQFGQSSCVPTDGVTTVCDYVGDDWTQWRVGLGLLDWNGFSLTGIYAQQDNTPAGQTFIQSAPDVDLATSGFFLPGGSEEVEQWTIQAGYSFGNNMIKAMYGAASYSGNELYGRDFPSYVVSYADDLYNSSRTAWAIGFDHNFSKRTTAYMLYTAVTDDQGDLPIVEGISGDDLPNPTRNDWSGFSIGLMHSF